MKSKRANYAIVPQSGTNAAMMIESQDGVTLNQMIPFIAAVNVALGISQTGQAFHAVWQEDREGTAVILLLDPFRVQVDVASGEMTITSYSNRPLYRQKFPNLEAAKAGVKMALLKATAQLRLDVLETFK